jgi:hypothetical protein
MALEREADMGKSVLETVLPMAAMVAAPYAMGAMGAGGALGAGTAATGAGAAGSAAGGAGTLGGAFGSADMLAAANVANNVPIAAGAASAGAAAAEAPIPYNSTMASFGPNNEFVGATIENAGLTPNSFTGGYDSAGTLGRLGQRLSHGMDQLSGGFNPTKMLNMGQPQQVQNVSRPPAIQRPQSQPETKTELPYGQGLLDVRNNMSEEEMKQRLMMARMGGLLNG